MDEVSRTDFFLIVDGKIHDEVLNAGPDDCRTEMMASFLSAVITGTKITWRFSNREVAELAHKALNHVDFLTIEVGDRESGQPFLV